MLIRYVGPFQLVEFEDARGLHTLAQGETIEVEDGSRLCEQSDNWQEVTPTPGLEPEGAK